MMRAGWYVALAALIAYLGAVLEPKPNSVSGAIITLLALFLPGFAREQADFSRIGVICIGLLNHSGRWWEFRSMSGTWRRSEWAHRWQRQRFRSCSKSIARVRLPRRMDICAAWLRRRGQEICTSNTASIADLAARQRDASRLENAPYAQL